ncbi:hypothetical protein [Sulfuriferula thiophila]|uniref:hypothetical protein n=1 Tax=Sulfuriferula thiophila TaxID=1781211 RepID=UPI000F60AF2E|nr:hypothetical protein [Sulfuriferula thiophila]
MLMRTRVLLLLLITFLPASVLAATPWEQYLDFPSAQNAKQVHSLTYSKGAASFGNYNGGDLQILALQVYAGDRESLRLAIRLKGQSDGGLAEDLTAIVGHVIRIHPQLFLEEIKFAKISITGLEDIVLNAGLEYADRPEANQYELNMRLEALSRVNEKELQVLRNTSIDAIKRESHLTLRSSGTGQKRPAP